MKIRPGASLPDQFRRLAAAQGCYWQLWRGQWVLRRKPQNQVTGVTPLQRQVQAEFKELVRAVANAPAWDRVEAEAISWGTPLTWRDVLTQAMLGRLVVIEGVLPEMAYPDLDMIGRTPGSLVVRETSNWLILPPGDNGLFLRMVDGFPRWRELPPPGPGTGGGLFGDILSAKPTLETTGFVDWHNQGSADTVENAVGLTIKNPASGTQTVRGISKNIGSTFKATFYFSLTGEVGDNVNNPAAYIAFSDGTKYEGIGFVNANGGSATYLVVSKWNSATSFSGNPVLFFVGAGAVSWLQVEKTSTQLIFRYSNDGVNFSLLFAEGITTFLSAASTVGLYATRGPSDYVYGTLMSYHEP